MALHGEKNIECQPLTDNVHTASWETSVKEKEPKSGVMNRIEHE